MRTKQLIEWKGGIFRVLAVREEQALLIDCARMNMPEWYLISALKGFDECTEEKLLEYKETNFPDLDTVSSERRRIAYNRYTVIAGILPFVQDDRMRSQMIATTARDTGHCKATIRNYLCRYLVFQNISALVPEERTRRERPLTATEKTFRWAINKYYYTEHKNSLMDAYTFMLRDKFCDESGTLVDDYPTFHQFRYFYSKYKKKQTVYISREGMKKYQRDYRPLLGDRIQEYASHVGVGEIDGTVCDIHLVDEYGQYIGRPYLTILSDSYSNGYVYGYSLTLEGGTYALRNLLLNCLTDKAEWCRRFGIYIDEQEWETRGVLPGTIVSDMGGEYRCDTVGQITELGITLINLPPLRPELKSIVERSFQLIQQSMRPALISNGYVDKDFGKRLAVDTRKEAVLTFEEYESCIIRAILYHNNHRMLEEYPYTEEMLQAEVKPHPRNIYLWGKEQDGADLRRVDKVSLIRTLLPRTMAHFTRKGLIVNGLRYDSSERNFVEQYLSGGEGIVAYSPDSVDNVYLIENGDYVEFCLIESRFSGKSIVEIDKMRDKQKQLVTCAEHENLQGRLDLQSHLRTVLAGVNRKANVKIKEVRRSRAIKRETEHKDFLKEVRDE